MMSIDAIESVLHGSNVEGSCSQLHHGDLFYLSVIRINRIKIYWHITLQAHIYAICVNFYKQNWNAIFQRPIKMCEWKIVFW